MIRGMISASSYNHTATPAVEQARRVWIQAAGVLGFALLTAAGAMVRIPLPGTPVPFTLQTLFVVLAGLTLGTRLGLASMGFYLLLGMTGYHVFAAASWGAGTILGPTGGYLLGFVLAQPVLGHITRPARGGLPALLAAACAGNAVIFGAGLIWLHLWMHTSLAATLTMGLAPFVPGLIVKTLAAVAAGRFLQPVSRRYFVRRC